MLLTVWLGVRGGALSLFLAHYIIIVININIIAVLLLVLQLFSFLTAQKENVFSEWEGNREKSKDLVCLFLCFGLIMFFFSTGLLCPCKMNEAWLSPH